MAWFRSARGISELDGLVLRAQRGDPRAFERLYRELHPLVARYVARRVSSPADAEDLCSKVFERLVAHLERFDPTRGCIEAWTLRIARNAIIDHQRARRPQVALDQAPQLDDPRRDPAAQLLAVEELGELKARVEALDPDARELLSLRFGDGLPHRALADLLGISEAAVRKRLSRTLKRLRTPVARAPQASSSRPEPAAEHEAAPEVEYVY